MQYETLTAERQQQLVEGQLNNMEAEHFNLALTDEVATAGGGDAVHKDRLAALEKGIAALKKRRPAAASAKAAE